MCETEGEIFEHSFCTVFNVVDYLYSPSVNRKSCTIYFQVLFSLFKASEYFSYQAVVYVDKMFVWVPRRPCGRGATWEQQQRGEVKRGGNMLVLFETAAGFAIFKVSSALPSCQRTCRGVHMSPAFAVFLQIVVNVRAAPGSAQRLAYFTYLPTYLLLLTVTIISCYDNFRALFIIIYMRVKTFDANLIVRKRLQFCVKECS